MNVFCLTVNECSISGARALWSLQSILDECGRAQKAILAALPGQTPSVHAKHLTDQAQTKANWRKAKRIGTLPKVLDIMIAWVWAFKCKINSKCDGIGVRCSSTHRHRDPKSSIQTGVTSVHVNLTVKQTYTVACSFILVICDGHNNEPIKLQSRNTYQPCSFQWHLNVKMFRIPVDADVSRVDSHKVGMSHRGNRCDSTVSPLFIEECHSCDYGAMGGLEHFQGVIWFFPVLSVH